MEILLCSSYDENSEKAAILTDTVKTTPAAVLGLATGSTPEGMYQRLIERYEAGDLDFSSVETFNLDEYYPLAAENEKSYHYYMCEKLFRHINVKKERIHILDGKAKVNAVRALLNDRITTSVPASLLKTYPNVILICDRAAYGEER